MKRMPAWPDAHLITKSSMASLRMLFANASFGCVAEWTRSLRLDTPPTTWPCA